MLRSWYHGITRLKYPTRPSGNLSSKVWCIGHDAHRLTSFDTCVRFYSNGSDGASITTDQNSLTFKTLVQSDSQRKTIFALSTPPGKAGVAVVRISGPDALSVWQSVVRPYAAAARNRGYPVPWKMERCHIIGSSKNEILDDGLAVFFKAPRSFTTEDVLELHIHSGRAIVSSVLAALSRQPSCRPAEPGEFTRRAFEGGRLDLTQVEGLKDLINAETETQRRLALQNAAGSTRLRFEELRECIIKSLAMVEALIDFGEGEDLEEGVYEQARERVVALHRTIQGHLSDNRRGEILRSGIRLAIFGPPNAGKSSLLNFLARREAAIVTPVPGTTRDILELSLDIGGLPVIVADTAGLRKTDDLIETIGVERAKAAVQGADITLCVLSIPEVWKSKHTFEIPSSLEAHISSETFYLFNKADLAEVNIEHALSSLNSRAWAVSLNTGQGTQEFLDNFAQALQKRYDLFEGREHYQTPLITHSRHRVHLETALKFLEAFLETTAEDVVIGAEELRYAARAIGKVSGLIDVEDVLDSVFHDFCIGK